MKAVLLDMYGVVLKDSGDSFYPYVNRTFPDLTPQAIYRHWDRADVGEITSHEVFRLLGYTGDIAAIEQTYLDTIEINDGFYAFAEEVCQHGKLALVSNDSSEWSRYLRSKFGINRYFDLITVSGDLKIKKPDPRIFTHTLERLGCTATDCVYVDDRRYNLAAAQALGMDVVLFNSRGVDYDGKAVSSFEELGRLLFPQ